MKPLAGGMIENVGIAFKYLMQFEDIVTIPGIEKPSEIEEIAALYESDKAMTADEEWEMKRIRAEMGNRFCHRCDYCQPCTTGIPISMIMTAKSFYKRLPKERFFSPMLKPAMEKAANCSECGECETRCPYHLPIREMMKEQVEWYQDLWAKYEAECADKA
jgi:predicted aldo/keto reductase-like oxidoreductase